VSRIIPDGKTYDKIRNFIITDNNVALAAYESKELGYRDFRSACHGSLYWLFSDHKEVHGQSHGDTNVKKRYDLSFFATACSYSKDAANYKAPDISQQHSFIQDYCEWLLSDNHPWTKITQGDIEPIQDCNGDIRGYILGPKALDVENRAGVYNFLVASRLMRDQPQLFMTYGNLLKEFGCSKYSALMLMPYLQHNRNIWNKASYWSSNHQPFKDISGGPAYYMRLNPKEYPKAGYRDEMYQLKFMIDLKAVKEGNYKFDNEGTEAHHHTNGWLKPYSEEEKTLCHWCDSEVDYNIKTRFSTVSGFTNDFVNSLVQKLEAI